MKENPFNKYADEYENWFINNNTFFESELLAIKQVVPQNKVGVEIGIGSGIFAEKLGIQFGIDPAENMLKYARARKLTVEQGFAENLPYDDNRFDFAAFITSISFIANPTKALEEAYRVTKPKGELIIAFIDKESALGRALNANKKRSTFYKEVCFHTVEEMLSLINSSNFKVVQIIQTLTNLKSKELETPLEGHGKGSFIVIKAVKT